MATDNIKYVTIRVRDSKTAQNGSGRVLLYDGKDDCYYVTSLSDILGMRDKVDSEARERMQAKLDAAKSEFESELSELRKENDGIRRDNAEFKKLMSAEYNALLSTVKEVNAKVIAMVDRSEEGHDI